MTKTKTNSPRKKATVGILVAGFLSASFGFALSQATNTREVRAYQSVEQYYANANTSSGSALLTSLQSITTKGSHVGSYDDLFETYRSSDVKDGYLVDMYSNTTRYTVDQKRCGNYKNEGDCWNREHSTPKSWWGGSTSNQGADPFILYPTDGKINGMRSNYPFGEVKTIEQASNNNYSLLGSADNSLYPYSGKVFEPADEWKGDLARSAFYTRARWSASYSWSSGYGNVIYSGSSSNNFGLTDYAVKLYTAWSNLDPVDEWELRRNEAIYAIQGNRNPFIDHPEYANIIWGGTTYTGGGATTPPNTITLNPASSSIAVGATVSLSVSVDSGSSEVTWSSNNTAVATVSNGVVTGMAAGTATITATSKLDNVVKGTATVTVKSISSLAVSGTPSKKTYTAGETFNPAGLTVTATYNDNSTSNVTSGVVWTPSPLTAGTTSVTGTYAGKNVTVSGITVQSNKTVTINKSNSGLPATGASSPIIKAYTVKNGTINDGTMSIKWGAGSYNYTQYDEIGLPNGVKIEPNDSTYVKTITADLYGYINSDVYANGIKITGTQGTSTTNQNSKVMIYTINSSNWYIVGNTAEHDQAFYSLIFSVGEDSSTPAVPVTGVSLNTNSLNLVVGNNSTLTATVAPTNATNKNVTWSSTNSSVASVSGGVVTANAAGSATITVTTVDGSFTATCSVSVTAPEKTLSSISATGYKASFEVGESFSFGGTVTATYSDSSTSDVTSSASFGGYNMNATGTQTVTVTYTYGSTTKTTSYQITVTSRDKIVQSLSASYSGGNVYVGGSLDDSKVNVTAQYTDSVKYPSEALASSDYSLSGFSSATAGNKIVTVTYAGDLETASSPLTTTFSVNVIADTVVDVTVSNTTTYHPGETIAKGDITVTLHYQSGATSTTSDFTFASDGYVFTYADTNSGASSKAKQFSITYGGDSYNFSVDVSRVAYEVISGSTTTLSSSQFSSSDVSKSINTPSETSVTIGGVGFTVDTNAYIYTLSSISYLSFAKIAGSIKNTEAFSSDLTSVSFTEKSESRQDGVITISKDGTNWVAYSTDKVAKGGYRFFKIEYSGSSSLYSNISSISFTLSGQDNAVNVANYVMFEDTTNQCTTKLDLAIDKLNSMSEADKSTFWTSSDYVIATARERLLAWAAHEGAELTYSDGEFQINTSNLLVFNPLIKGTADSILIIVIGMSLLSVAGVVRFKFWRRRREN